jgi:hypothetical protein
MQRVSIIAVCGWLLFSPFASAEIVFIKKGAPSEVRVTVGADTGVTTVNYEVPAVMSGDGTPISGTPAGVLIRVSARRATSQELNQVYYILTADSSVPLTNGVNTIPFTEISWTAQDGDIPAGRFDGTSSQIILGPTRSRWQVSDWHTFTYDNTLTLPAGVYTGSVTYTISIP